MKQRTRIQCTDAQKGLMWDRRQKGDSLRQIARLFDRHHTSVQPARASTSTEAARTCHMPRPSRRSRELKIPVAYLFADGERMAPMILAFAQLPAAEQERITRAIEGSLRKP